MALLLQLNVVSYIGRHGTWIKDYVFPISYSDNVRFRNVFVFKIKSILIFNTKVIVEKADFLWPGKFCKQVP